MRVGLISDMHEHFPNLNNLGLDGLIIAGDIAFKPYGDIRAERDMWQRKLIPWLADLDINHILVCPGNHDWFPYLFPVPAFNLCRSISRGDKQVNLYGLDITHEFDRSIGWLPFSLAFCDWVFNAEERKLGKMLDYIGKVDVLVSHGPVYGFGDTDKNGVHGSKGLLRFVEDYSPKFVFCGHIHSGRGIYKYNNTTIVNCAFTNDNYNAVNKIYVWCTDTDVITEELCKG